MALRVPGCGVCGAGVHGVAPPQHPDVTPAISCVDFAVAPFNRRRPPVCGGTTVLTRRRWLNDQGLRCQPTVVNGQQTLGCGRRSGAADRPQKDVLGGCMMAVAGTLPPAPKREPVCVTVIPPRSSITVPPSPCPYPPPPVQPEKVGEGVGVADSYSVPATFSVCPPSPTSPHMPHAPRVARAFAGLRRTQEPREG